VVRNKSISRIKQQKTGDRMIASFLFFIPVVGEEGLEPPTSSV
jgi:hypothetical protein